MDSVYYTAYHYYFPLQTSRAGRLAAFADSQLSDHSDMPDTAGGGGGGGNGGQLAEVVFTKLVVVAGGERGERRKEKESKKNVGRRSGVKNFKKFRKVTCEFCYTDAYI